MSNQQSDAAVHGTGPMSFDQPSFPDILGQRVSVGDCITYPGRSGSSMWMSVGKVSTIREYQDRHGQVRYEVSVTKFKKLTEFDIKWRKRYNKKSVGDIVELKSTIYVTKRVVKLEPLTNEQLVMK